MRKRERRNFIPYAPFEALKVRDLGSNRYLITVFITSERFFPFKKGLKILRHQRLFLNLRTFLDSGLERGVCLPAKNPEREKESEREGDGL